MLASPSSRLAVHVELFGTTTDDLAAGTVTNARPLRSVQLLEPFRALWGSTLEHQDAVMNPINVMIAMSQVEGVVTSVRKRAIRYRSTAQ